MKRIISLLAVMAIMAAMVAVMAMPALAAPQGKGPGGCSVPGATVFSFTAKQEGSNAEPFDGLTPGQAVKQSCTPAGS